MEQGTVYVGLDYHENSVQVCAVDASGRVLRNRVAGNNVMDVTGATSGLGAVARVAIESCCGAADLAEALRRDASWPVDLAHAGYVHRMKANPDKSDYTDARMLAELARTGFVPKVWLAPKPIRELRSLVRYRQQLVNERRAIKARLLGLLRNQRVRYSGECGRWTKGWLAWLQNAAELSEQGRWIVQRHLEGLKRLKADVELVEARLTKTTEGDPVVARLLEQPGVGPVTAWMLRAHIGWFDRFKNGKQLARYCGLSPRNASSGKRQADAGVIRAGDRYLKAVLIEAGHRLARLDDRWKNLAGKLRRKGKPGSVVAAAVANRWVRWLFHEMKEIKAAA
jgi:transposase